MIRFHALRLGLTLCVVACVASQASGDDYASGPRLGKYRILSYGAVSKPPLVLGSFVLSEGGRYQAFLVGDKPVGEGTYSYDAAKRAVTWKTGPYVNEWGGDFEIDRDGKTHKIRMKRTTIGTNSVDSDK
jgi:hypothetical protein